MSGENTASPCDITFDIEWEPWYIYIGIGTMKVPLLIHMLVEIRPMKGLVFKYPLWVIYMDRSG